MKYPIVRPLQHVLYNAKPLRSRQARDLSFAALLFWSFSYVLLTLRSLLISDDGTEAPNIKRAIATAAGAAAFAACAALLDRNRSDSAKLLRWLGCSALLSIVAVLGVRLGIAVQASAGAEIDLAAELRWMLVWTGYFIGFLMTWIALRLSAERTHRAPASAGADAAAPAVGKSVGVWVQSRGLWSCIDVGQIDFLEADGNYVRVHFGDRAGSVRAPLKKLAAQVGDPQFVQIHRSVVCRRSVIAGVRRTSSGAFVAVCRGGRELPIGRQYINNVGLPIGRPDASS